MAFNNIYMNTKARVIAFYLPQFHPIPENDRWWGKGFTEWTNVGKAKPLFRGHYQPRVPADLGYYDLRIPEIRETQAQMAREAGVEGFMYWHYWFGNGRTLLEMPFQEVLKSGRPDFPFCLGWANHSWSNHTWVSEAQYHKPTVWMEQLYLGMDDYTNHFFYVLPAFLDSRYLRVDNKPIFYVHAPIDFPEIKDFIALWQKLARENGLEGIHFIGQSKKNLYCERILELGFDAIARDGLRDAIDAISSGKHFNSFMGFLRNHLKIIPLNKFKYAKVMKRFLDAKLDVMENVYPIIVSNYDHTPRSGRKALILHKSTPELFKKILHDIVALVQFKKDDHKIIFLRSWNEWAEGNYVEPDLKFGNGYLDSLKNEIFVQSLNL